MAELCAINLCGKQAPGGLLDRKLLFAAWYEASQAMITLGALLLFSGFVLGGVYLFIERFRNSKVMIAIIGVLAGSGELDTGRGAL